MSDTVIKIENLSKIYRLGEVGTGTLSHDLNRWWARMRGKEDPFALVGQTNDRTKQAESDYVYALKDINLEVKQGEILGVIGKNGAGKSTLLKILSRITTPSTGSIKVKGRIASLLEVGTGMNPEMTGRENIYLNGAIMGMSRAEITRKFDEIVDFAGCAMYVDTPVKRYSSGMRVRLGFAVAAFLEPEILVVDEVLAVGDAEFKKKAIGKMQDVSTNEGRTVLFVSHNMASIKSLCTRGIILENGCLTLEDKIESVTKAYIKSNVEVKSPILGSLERKKGYGVSAKFVGAEILSATEEVVKILRFGEPFKIRLKIIADSSIQNLNVGVRFENTSDVFISSCLSGDSGMYFSAEAESENTIEVRFDSLILNPGDYKMALSIRQGNVFVDQLTNVLPFSVDELPYRNSFIPNGAWGLVAFKPIWNNL
ncbi:ABC transporter ATP-binding protein [Persicobacter psychrovividus]|uniref:ABC transporter ATP-binding protein n=1 Tax=Persicobacter psychrovividus TaxID=387638 RepID=A0ABN6L5Z5_9BACT|nr:ABC transporter ATP-binding protein [Persicobacter psychrovividus]